MHDKTFVTVLKEFDVNKIEPVRNGDGTSMFKVNGGLWCEPYYPEKDETDFITTFITDMATFRADNTISKLSGKDAYTFNVASDKILTVHTDYFKENVPTLLLKGKVFDHEELTKHYDMMYIHYTNKKKVESEYCFIVNPKIIVPSSIKVEKKLSNRIFDLVYSNLGF